VSDNSAIEWTDSTWNVVTGCTRVSPGCANCYIERTPPFRISGRRFERIGNEETTGLVLHPERLEIPLRWRKPRRIFVNSLSDLFHEELDYHFVREVFNVMRRCDGGVVAATGKADPSHTFQVLTKRPERVLEWWRERKLGFDVWPPNVWLGVSIENARYTWRADVLREIPAAVRFISAEPLLGSLYPSRATLPLADQGVGRTTRKAGNGGVCHPASAPLDLTGIDWLIVGGESGPGARPMHPDWARELREQCLYGTGETRPAFFFKQWGEWSPGSNGDKSLFVAPDGFTSKNIWTDERLTDDRRRDGNTERWRSLVWMGRRGKKAAGRELDGRTWDEMPAAAADRASA